MHKETEEFCLKLPLWTVLGVSEKCEENISVEISGLQAEIRPKNLQSVSQKIFRLSHPTQ